MPGTFESLVDQVVSELQLEAKNEDVEIDPSLGVELWNYSRHKGVHDLDEQDLRLVLTGIGLRALRHPQRVKVGHRFRVGGRAVRLVISDLCPEAFGDCSDVARALIERERSE